MAPTAKSYSFQKTYRGLYSGTQTLTSHSHRQTRIYFLHFDPPAVVDDGKFCALQINLTLGTAAYATMALREVTKTETSSHFQTGLTQASEDQQFRGVIAGDQAGEQPGDNDDAEIEASDI